MPKFDWIGGNGSLDDADQWDENPAVSTNPVVPGIDDDAQITVNDATLSGSLNVMELDLQGSIIFDNADLDVSYLLTIDGDLTLSDGNLVFTDVNANLTVDDTLEANGTNFSMLGGLIVGGAGTDALLDLGLSADLSAAWIHLGDAAGTAGKVTLSGGSTIHTDYVTIGNVGDGEMDLTSSAKLLGLSGSFVSSLVVGFQGDGILNVTSPYGQGYAGVQIDASEMDIGYQADSQGTVTLDEAGLAVSNVLTIGLRGDGILVETSGTIIAANIQIAAYENSAGNITVNSRLIVAAPDGQGGYNSSAYGNLNIGFGGDAWAKINPTAQVTAGNINIASQSSSVVTDAQSGGVAGVIILGATVTAEQNFVVGDRGIATAIATNSTLSSQSAAIGAEAGAIGDLQLNGSNWATGSLQIGGTNAANTGDGTLEIANASVVDAGLVQVGDGVLTLESAANLYADNLSIGEGAVSDFEEMAHLSGLTNTALQTLTIGDNFQGTMEVAAGSGFAANQIAIGNATNVKGTLTFNGSYLDAAQFVDVGVNGDGLLTQAQGAIVATNLTAGVNAGADGEVDVMNANTRLIVDTPAGNANTLGLAGTGNLIVGVQSSGVANFTNGAFVEAGNATFAAQANSNANVMVNAATFAVDANLVVGDQGNAQLNVENGASMSSGAAIIGNQPQSVGNVTVDHASWTSNSVLVAGGFGTGDSEGVVNIQNGATVTISGSNGAFVIGDNSQSQGIVNIAGSSSVLDVSGAAADLLTVGRAGNGQLNASQHALIKSQAAIIGLIAGSNGAVTLDNSGWLAFSVTVGDAGTGQLTVQNASALSTQDLLIAADSDSNMMVSGQSTVTAYNVQVANGATNEQGMLKVSGAGSVLTTNGGANKITVGGFGQGAMVVDQQAAVTTGALAIGGNPAGTGQLTVSNAATVTATSVEIGGTGILNLTGSGVLAGAVTVDASGTLNAAGGVINGAVVNNGAVAVQSDILQINGALSGTGTVSIESNATLELTNGTTGIEQIVFGGANEILGLATGASVVAVTNFKTQDLIQINSFKTTYQAVVHISATGGTLDIVDSATNAIVASIGFTSSIVNENFTLTRDTNGDTDIGLSVLPGVTANPGDVVFSNLSGQPYQALEELFDGGQFIGVDYFFTNVPSGSAYSSYVYDYSAGNDFIGSSFLYTSAPQGANYTGYEYDYNGGGTVTRAGFTGVTGTGYSSYEYDYTGGVFAGSKFEVTSVPQGATYSSYELDYNSSGSFAGDKFFFTNVTGQSYTGLEEDFDASGRLAEVLLGGVSGQSYSSLEEDYSGGTYTGYKAYYTSITGQSYTKEEVDVTAANAITKLIYSGLTSTPYSSAEKDYSAGALSDVIYDFTNVSGASAYAYQVEDNAGGVAIRETYDNSDGSHTMIGLGAANQTFTSIANDTMTGGSAAETFVFNPVYGHDTVTDFSSFLSGATHDTISLASSEFANFAAVLADMQNAGSNVMITAPAGDTITLDNITKTTLSAYSADFTFHG